MKKLLLLSLLPFTAAAQNLVANGDFNRINICEAGSPCAPGAWYTSYDIDWAYQRFRRAGIDGSLCLIFAVDAKARSYWQSELVAPLKAGGQYRLTYYARSIEGEDVPRIIQFAFTRNRTHLLGTARLAAVTPATLRITKEKRDRDGWIKVTAEYTATGGETWIIAGNLGEYAPAPRTFCLVDDLSLEPVKHMSMPAAEYDARVSALYQPRLRHELRPKLPVVKEPALPAGTISAAPQLAPKTDTLRVPDILFATDSDVLEDTAVLAGLPGKISAAAYSRILVQGHTDNSGTGEHNAELSERRAGAVAAWLARNGIPAGKLTVTGMGSGHPLRPNDTPANRRINRRVELVVLRE